MKGKKILQVVSILAVATTLVACGDKVTTKDYENWADKNGYVKVEENTLPLLEVSFSDTASKITGDVLVNKFGREETFIFFWGSEECGTCGNLKTQVDGFVKETGYRVYYYYSDDAYDSSIKTELGLAATAKVSTPTMYYVVDGERVNSWVIPLSVPTTAQLKASFEEYFNLDNAGKWTTASRTEFTTLEQLVTKVASEEKFLLLTSRYACPHCNRLQDPNRDNVVTKLALLWEGNFNYVVSENVESSMAADNASLLNKTANSIFYDLNDLRVAELTIYVVTTGELAPEDLGVTFDNAGKATFDKTTFYTNLNAYALSDQGRQFAQGKMDNAIKFVPTFEAVNYSANVGVANDGEKDVVVFENVIAQTLVQNGGNITPTWKIVDGKAVATYNIAATVTGDKLDERATLRYSYFAKMLNGATSPTDGMNNAGSITATGLLNNEYSVNYAWYRIANWAMSWAPQNADDYVASYTEITATNRYDATAVTLTSYAAAVEAE